MAAEWRWHEMRCDACIYGMAIIKEPALTSRSNRRFPLHLLGMFLGSAGPQKARAAC
jgi:hypothetical protein